MSTEFLLASDIDGTVLPAPGGSQADPAIDALRAALDTIENGALAYVTGRDLDLALEAIEHGRLPRPDRIVGDVGTVAFRPAGNAWESDPEFARQMAALAGCQDLRGVATLLAGFEDLKPQPVARQGPFKRSYFAPAGRMVDDSWQRALRDHLLRSELDLRMVLSQEPQGRGLIDILPRAAGKATAVRLLREQFEVAERDTLFAGDSGNDSDALLSGVRAVLVGNAPDLLRTELRRTSELRGLAQSLYFARAHGAAGVLEALAHFGWIDGVNGG